MAQLNSFDGRITDEGIEAIRSDIGKKHQFQTWNRRVTKDSIEHFALGVGDDNPLWWDDEYAASSPWRKRVAPPTYLYSHMRAPRLRREHGVQAVENYLPGVLAIWSGDNWRWNRLPMEGDEIRGESVLVDVKVAEGRFGGRAVTHTEKISLVTLHGEVVAEIEKTIKRFDRSETRERRTYLDRLLARYTEVDRARFAAQYESEAAARRGSRIRFIEDVQIGEKIGPLLKGPLTITNLVGWILGGGSNLNPTNRILHQFAKLHPAAMLLHPETGIWDTIEAPHWDAAFARQGGFPTGYDLGAMRISWFSHLVTDWAGDHGLTVALDTRMRRPNFMGDVTWINGEVVSIDNTADGRVGIRLTATNQLDEVTASGHAEVKLSRKRKD